MIVICFDAISAEQEKLQVIKTEGIKMPGFSLEMTTTRFIFVFSYLSIINVYIKKMYLFKKNGEIQPRLFGFKVAFLISDGPFLERGLS